MKKHIFVSDIARRARATQADIDAIADDALYGSLMNRDGDGRWWVTARREGLIYGALDSEAWERKNTRIKTADQDLLAAYAELQRAGRRSPSSPLAAARHHQRMLSSVLRVLEALTELVDAKADKGSMDPAVAAEIKTAAEEIRRDAGDNAMGTLRVIRTFVVAAA